MIWFLHSSLNSVYYFRKNCTFHRLLSVLSQRGGETISSCTPPETKLYSIIGHKLISVDVDGTAWGAVCFCGHCIVLALNLNPSKWWQMQYPCSTQAVDTEKELVSKQKQPTVESPILKYSVPIVPSWNLSLSVERNRANLGLEPRTSFSEETEELCTCFPFNVDWHKTLMVN